MPSLTGGLPFPGWAAEPDVELSTERFGHIVEHNAGDLTAVVQAGTPLADAQALFNAVGSADKTLRIFSAEEGGAQHCQNDYLTHGSATIFDWLAEKL